MLRNFFMEFFMSAEVYFRSPFGHLPVTFAQTRDSSSLIFSANLEPFRARLRGLEAEKRVFTQPPVQSVKNYWVYQWLMMPSGLPVVIVTPVTPEMA